jgi:hypothetical protein
MGVVMLIRGRTRPSVLSTRLEYKATELPMLASCDPGSASSDTKAIAATVLALWVDAFFRCEAGRRGRSYLEKRHSLEAGTSTILSILGAPGAEAQPPSPVRES